MIGVRQTRPDVRLPQSREPTVGQLRSQGGPMATQQETERAVAALLAQAGSAHGAYEERDLGGVYDQHWPDWYAAYLVEHGLGRLLSRAVAVQQLSGFLKRCDE